MVGTPRNSKVVEASLDDSMSQVSPKEVVKDALNYLNSVYSSPSVIGETSFSRNNPVDQSGVRVDSLLGSLSPHDSFIRSTETSLVAPPVKRRRSIKESDYASLLATERSGVSTYNSLFQASQTSILAEKPLQGLNSLSNLQAFVDRRLSNSSTLDSISIRADSVSHGDSSVLQPLNPSPVKEDELPPLDPEPMDQGSEEDEKGDENKEEEREEEEEKREEEEPKSEEEQIEEKKDSEEEQQEDEDNQEEHETTGNEEISTEPPEAKESDHSANVSIDQGGLSGGSFTQLEETTIRDLLDDSLERPPAGASLLEPTQMPPPTRSLKLRIPEKGVSRRGRKKGSKGEFDWLFVFL